MATSACCPAKTSSVFTIIDLKGIVINYEDDDKKLQFKKKPPAK